MEINLHHFADTVKDYVLNWTIWLFQAEVNVTGANFTLCMTSNINKKEHAAFLHPRR